MAEHKSFRILLPCESWSEFPAALSSRPADELLSAWCALWHPAALGKARKLPGWHSASDPPEDHECAVALIPSVGREPLPSGWLAASGAPAKLVLDGREPLEVLTQRVLDAAGVGNVSVDTDLRDDFQALGFCYLHVQLLNHQMHYASHLDDDHFEQRLIDAADACLNGDRETATNGLAGLFDLLMEARDHFYPVDTYLVELALVAPTTLDQTLRNAIDGALGSRQPLNVLVEASLVEQLAEVHPTALDALRRAWDESAVEVIGGHYREGEFSLLPAEAFLRDLLHGRSTYLKHLGSAPTVYARRTFGLHCAVPQIISQSGFVGGLISPLDAGQAPTPEQCRTRWESSDGRAIDCLASHPLDASDPATYLGLARSLGESIERDFVATLLLVHWPQRESHWHHLLKRTSRFGPVLGKFITLKDYFASTDPPGIVSKFKADQFASPFVTSSPGDEMPDPITRHVAAYRRYLATGVSETLRAMARWTGSAARRETEPCPQDLRRAASASAPAADDVGRAATELAHRLAVNSHARSDAEHGGEPTGRLALNPLTHGSLRRVVCPAGGVPGRADPTNDDPSALIDIPGLGFAWTDAAHAARADRPVRRLRGETPVAEADRLRNEFFEARVHPRTGGIQAIWDYVKRGNLISQQLAYRSAAPPDRPGRATADGPPGDHYSQMVAEQIQVASVDRTQGKIVSRGTLRDSEDRPLARFEQTMRVQRGSRVLLVDVSLIPDVLPEGPPWECYYGVRLAWADESAEIYRGVAGGRRRTERQRWESPEWWEIVSGASRVTLFPLGMPFHHRSGPRMADLLLAPAGETCRTFRFGIGIGVEHPHHTALEMAVADLPLVVPATCPNSGPAGWLLSVDRPNTVITHAEPLPPDDGDPARGSPAGFRVRLLETEGRSGPVRLDSFRPIRRAERTDFVGHSLGELTTDDGGVHLAMGPYEWMQIEARWQ